MRLKVSFLCLSVVVEPLPKSAMPLAKVYMEYTCYYRGYLGIIITIIYATTDGRSGCATLGTFYPYTVNKLSGSVPVSPAEFRKRRHTEERYALRTSGQPLLAGFPGITLEGVYMIPYKKNNIAAVYFARS